MRYFFLLFFLFISLAFAEEIQLSTKVVMNGKTLFVELPQSSTKFYKKAKVGNKEYQVFPYPLDAKRSYLLLPFSYYESAGIKKVNLEYREEGVEREENFIIEVVDGNYPKEKITVNSSKVNPKSKAVQKRVSKEYKEAMNIYNNVTPKSYLNKPFILPLQSKITSSFGKARVYNGSLKGYHSGTDFRAKVGTAVIASNDAVVVLVKRRFYSGGTVLLNHGEGIYTCYFHMSQFQVKEGDMVKRGEVLGLSGQSGRVSGPHLHFAVRINGTQVDPLQFIELFNKNLLQRRE